MEKNMHSRFTRLLSVLLAGLLPVTQTAALEQQDNILVTATRLDADTAKARGNVTVITAAEIENSTARTLPELLGREAGILTRSLYGNNAARSIVDIRGFGAAATQNTLILLDGRRLNDVDLSAVDFSAIPLESIERIEILRNSGAVLYGDGAVGGAINIITRQPGKAGTTGFVKAGIGNLGTRTGDAHVSHTDGAVSILLGAHGIRSDGYRDNNDLKQRTLNSDLRYAGSNHEAFLKAWWDDQDLDLPGVRRVDPNTGLDELQDDRKGTGTPHDYADQRGYGITTGLTRYLDNGSEVVMDVGFRKKNQKAFFDDYLFDGAFANYLDSDLKTWSATPRLVIPHTLAGIDLQTITGIDYYHSKYQSDRSLNPNTRNDPVHQLDITQKTASVYLDTTLSVNDRRHFNLGARLERVRIDAEDDVDTAAPGGAFASAAPDYDQSDWVYMLEAGAEQQVKSHTAVYLKATRSVRVATVDELFELDPVTFVQVFSQLDPQTGKGVDAGVKYSKDRVSGQVNLYYMRLEDEIHFDPNTFSNINLDPTRRYGVEVNGRTTVLKQLDLQASYTYMRAEFRDGPFDGNDIPLVPQHTASASATWRWTPETEFMGAVNFVGERYFDNDQANDFRKKIPSYETIDLQASHRYRGFRFAARVNNLLDKKYYDYGVSSTFTPGVYTAFPLPERTFLVTVSKELGARE
jgi:iron complex outermembrane receptor protein